MNITSTRFGYGVLITPQDIQEITGHDLDAAIREHQYIRSKYDSCSEDLSLEQFCEHFQLNPDEVMEHLNPPSTSPFMMEDTNLEIDLFEEQEDEYDRLIKEIELDPKYKLATKTALSDIRRHQTTSTT